MISNITQTLGKVASAYFHINGWSVSVDTKMLFSYIFSVIEKDSLEAVLELHVRNRLLVLSDYVVGCFDFTDVGWCERMRDRLYETICQEIEDYLRRYITTAFRVPFDLMEKKIEHLDSILEKATSVYLSGKVSAPDEAIAYVLGKEGIKISYGELSGISQLIARWCVSDIDQLRALMFVMILTNYIMGYIMFYLEEKKHG